MAIRAFWTSAFCALFIVVSSISPRVAHAGSSVGNGGDIFSHYVESSRFALNESIRRLIQNPSDLGRLCEDERELDAGQKAECRDFFAQTMRQMLDLNQRPPVPEFLLRAEPLFVEGSDGKPREIDARTPLGAAGDIELSFGRVKFYSPYQMLTLVTHEFGHKVIFNGRSIEDNQPTGAFKTGRMLLDSVGVAVATYAREKGIIGSYFKLLDHFSCQITSFSGGMQMGSSGFSTRSFSSAQDFGRYQTGISLLPGNLDVYLIEQGFSEIHFRVAIHEENSCSTATPSTRWTKVALVREYPSTGARAGKLDEVLAETTVDQWNPVCDEPAARKPMGLSYGNFRFECFYNGSSGTSSQE